MSDILKIVLASVFFIVAILLGFPLLIKHLEKIFPQNTVNIIILFVNCIALVVMVATILANHKSSMDLIATINNSTRSQIEKMDGQITLLKDQVYLTNSLSIPQLGDRCMWNTPHGGDYSSFLILKNLEGQVKDENIKNNISSQIRRIEDMYKSDVMIANVKNLRAIWKVGSTETNVIWEDENTFSASNVLHHMYRNLWTERAKASYFLNKVNNEKLENDSKSWGDVFEALKHNISDNEWALIVRRTALLTYVNLTSNTSVPFKPSGIFDFDGALTHWENNKDKLLEEKEKNGR